MTDTASSPKDTPVLDIKSATLYALRVVLHSADLQELLEALEKRMLDADGFFDDETVVIDVSAITEPPDWKPLIKTLRQHKLRPIGVVGNAEMLASARQAGLEAVDLSSAVVRTPAAKPEVSEPSASEVVNATAKETAASPGLSDVNTSAPAATVVSDTEAAAPTMIIERPLRSGQRIYARNADLIVVGMVSQGAEVIADGNIHVYGPLRGKAMAGARGNTKARIFTTQLDPELLAVAGVYRVIESTLEPQFMNQAAIVQLEGDTLQIVPVGTKV